MNKIVICVVVILISCQISAMEKQSVSDEEAEQWIRHCLPLPKQIKISEKLEIKPADLGIISINGNSIIVKTAVKEFKELYKGKTGVEPEGSKFQIILKLLDRPENNSRQNDQLKACKNSTQAYLIEPDGKSNLTIYALNEKGLYYALATLRQLLEKEASTKKITVPLVSILDWPDLAERGIWNGFVCRSPEIVPWLSSMKLNFLGDPRFLKDGWQKKDGKVRPYVRYRYPGYKKVHESGTSRVIVWPGRMGHINFWHWEDFYPDLLGKGKEARQSKQPYLPKRHIVSPCGTHPELVRIITEAMSLYPELGIMLAPV